MIVLYVHVYVQWLQVDMDMNLFRHNNFTVLYMDQFINVDFFNDIFQFTLCVADFLF